jgi:tetratricopeptide (TPR) repeat protein
MNKENLLSELEEALKNSQVESLTNLSKQAVENFPEESFGYYFLAEANLLEFNYNNAEICLAKAIELDDDVMYKLRFAQVKENQGLMDDARLTYAMILDTDSSNYEALVGLGHYYYEEAQDFELAIKYYSNAIDSDPKNKDTYIYRAHAYAMTEDFDAAMKDIASAESSEFDESLETIKTQVYSNFPDKKAEMQAAFKKLADNLPDSFYHRFNYANFLFSEQNFTGAEAEFIILSETDKKEGNFTPEIYDALASIKINLNKFTEALPFLNLLIENDATVADYFLKRAIANYHLEKFETALTDLKSANSIATENEKPDILSQEAETYFKMGKFLEAKNAFDDLSKMDTYYKKGVFGMGRVLFAENKKEEALKVLNPIAQKGDAEVRAFIRQQLNEQLKIQANNLETALAENFKDNERSILSPFFGKLYKFDAALNKPEGNLPAAFIKKLNESLEYSYLILTERAILVVFEHEYISGFYKIIDADTKKVNIEIMATNAGTSMKATLSVDGKSIGYGATGSPKKPMFFSETASKLDSNGLKAFKKYVQVLDFEVLGSKADEFKKAVV